MTTLTFPDDRPLRRALLSPAGRAHPAKAHLGLWQHLIATYTRAGDTIIDPMAGVGATALALPAGRNAILMDVEPRWLRAAHQNAAALRADGGGWFYVRRHDARTAWPVGGDVVLTSPPYGCESKRQARRLAQALAQRRQARGHAGGRLLFAYGESAAQIGHYRGRRYWAAMRAIYANAARALRPGGRMVLVLKDHINDGAWVRTADQTVELCQQLGWRLVERHRHQLARLSHWQALRRAAGLPVVDYEDILILRR